VEDFENQLKNNPDFPYLIQKAKEINLFFLKIRKQQQQQ